MEKILLGCLLAICSLQCAACESKPKPVQITSNDRFWPPDMIPHPMPPGGPSGPEGTVFV